MNWYLAVLREYTTFSGRARRTEYWIYTLVQALISILLGILGAALFDNRDVLVYVYAAATLLPSLAVGVRRLHDTDKSGWWLLLLLVPIVGPLVLLVLCALPGTPGANRYGPPARQTPAPITA